MATMNLEQIREELVNTLRSSDILSITVRGVLTHTQPFTATAGQTNFVIGPQMRNTRSVTVNAANKYLYTDYTVNWITGTVIFNTGLVLSDAVSITYDSGTSDKIYPDMPRDDLGLTSYPRIGMSLVDVLTNPIGLYGLNHVSDVLITIYLWVPANKDSNVGGGIGGTYDLYNLMTSIRNVIRTNSKLFQSFKYITPRGNSVVSSGHHARTEKGEVQTIYNNKIIQISQDFVIKFVFEIG